MKASPCFSAHSVANLRSLALIFGISTRRARRIFSSFSSCWAMPRCLLTSRPGSFSASISAASSSRSSLRRCSSAVASETASIRASASAAFAVRSLYTASLMSSLSGTSSLWPVRSSYPFQSPRSRAVTSDTLSLSLNCFSVFRLSSCASSSFTLASRASSVDSSSIRLPFTGHSSLGGMFSSVLRSRTAAMSVWIFWVSADLF
mmetsp:Transcript_39623/g.65839  ORF Transcript_39623/g.65839 Transcript_39623/m.65839 type:complete len:204 (-) Transcript_39623:592-1203(-)